MERQVRMVAPGNVATKKVHWKDLEVNTKTMVSDDNEVHILESAVAPAPSRDFYYLEVTKASVVLTLWKISHSPKATPTKYMTELRAWTQDLQMVLDIARIFGMDMINRINYLSEFHYGVVGAVGTTGGEGEGPLDLILKLPDVLLAKIFGFVGIESLGTLAPVCKKFKKVCKCNALWESFYDQYKVSSNDEDAKEKDDLEADAMEFTWKGVFLRDRIQDNVFEERMRLGPSPKPAKSAMKRIPLSNPTIPLYF